MSCLLCFLVAWLLIRFDGPVVPTEMHQETPVPQDLKLLAYLVPNMPVPRMQRLQLPFISVNIFV